MSDSSNEAVVRGVYQSFLDDMELEELAREAASRSRYSFLFMASPLWIRGATGSPFNPLAVF